MPRLAKQGVNVDLAGAGTFEWREQDPAGFSDDTKRMLTDVNGFSYYPMLLDPTATSEAAARNDTRLQPLEWRQRAHQDFLIVEHGDESIGQHLAVIYRNDLETCGYTPAL